MLKFLHTRIRVSSLEASVAFYQKLGFVESRRQDSPAGNKLVFMTLPGNEHFLELCWSADYEVKVPEDLMHTCVGVPNILVYCDKLEAEGIEIWPAKWREIFIDSVSKRMAFVTDPDGYEVEILER